MFIYHLLFIISRLFLHLRTLSNRRTYLPHHARIHHLLSTSPEQHHLPRTPYPAASPNANSSRLVAKFKPVSRALEATRVADSMRNPQTPCPLIAPRLRPSERPRSRITVVKKQSRTIVRSTNKLLRPSTVPTGPARSLLLALLKLLALRTPLHLHLPKGDRRACELGEGQGSGNHGVGTYTV